MIYLAIHPQPDWTKSPLLVIKANLPERCEVYEINLGIQPEWQRTQNQEEE